MSLKKNTLANYLGSFYVTFAGILAVPLYVSYLGAEAYGLIGFFTLLQQWLRVLDFGLTPTLSREAARYKAGALGDTQFKTLVRSLELFFVAIAVMVAALLTGCNDWLASSWIKNEAVPYSILQQSLLLMGLTIPVRWVMSLYRSALVGMEKHIWLNCFNIVSASLRVFGAILVMELISSTLVAFFAWQAFLAIVEATFLSRFFYQNMPLTQFRDRFSWPTLKKVLPFAGTIAFTSTVWLLISQSDKLIFSGLLPLREFGYFTMATTAAFAIAIFSEPIGKVLLPRMTFLLSQHRETEMLQLYRKATQFVLVIVSSLTAVLATYASPIIYAWVGQHEAARAAGPVLFWYACGNGILSLLAFQYYLQYAYGNLKYHFWFNVVFAVLWVPIVWFVARIYGPVGSGKLWFALQMLTFCGWTWYIHQKFAPGLHFMWLKEDIAPTVLATGLTLAIIQRLLPDLMMFSRPHIFIIITCATCLLLLVGAISSSACRAQTAYLFNSRRRND